MMALLLTIDMPVRVIIVEEHRLVDQISSKGDCRNAQAGKGAFESVESGERTGISPALAIRIQNVVVRRMILGWIMGED